MDIVVLAGGLSTERDVSLCDRKYGKQGIEKEWSSCHSF